MQTVNQTHTIPQESVPPGWRFVRFEYPTSIGFTTVRRQSRVFATQSRTERVLRGLGYNFLALALGPWGVPWGIYWTAQALWVNLNGGADVTGDELHEALRKSGI